MKVKQIQRDEHKEEPTSILRRIIQHIVVYKRMINSSQQIELNLNQNMMKGTLL